MAAPPGGGNRYYSTFSFTHNLKNRKSTDNETRMVEGPYDGDDPFRFLSVGGGK